MSSRSKIVASVQGSIRGAVGTRELYEDRVVARVFLIDPAEVEGQSRTKAPSKHRHNLTYEELDVNEAAEVRPDLTAYD
jgi:hypothetical protein